MKLRKYISILTVLLVGLYGCSDDLDKVTYHPGDAKPSEFAPVKGDYDLDKEGAENIVDTFKWGKMDFGYNAAVTYTVEIDLAGKNFENPKVVTSTPKLETEILNKSLNTAMVELQRVYGFIHGVAQDIEIRIKGSISESAQPVFSNIHQAKVVSYFTYPKVWVIGDYNGWNFSLAQFLFGFDEDQKDLYSAWIGFDGKASNGFKITDSAGWGNGNWGLKDENKDKEVPELKLFNDGGSQNIEVYSKNFYKFSFNKASETLVKIASMDSFGIAGSAVKGADVQFAFDGTEQEFFTTTTLEKGEIYFRADGKDGDLTYGKGSAEGQLAAGNKGIAVEAGVYVIRVNINDDNNLNYSIEEGEALNPDKITPAEFIDLGDITLNASAKTTITWSAADFGGQTPTAVTYILQMALDTEFTQAIDLVTTKELSYTTTGTDLLAKINELKADAQLGDAVKLNWRVVSQVMSLDNVFTSEVVTNQVAVKEDPAFPENLYMIGDAFGSWDWASEGVVEMIPVNGQEGKFWTIKYIKAGSPFKWNSKLDWGGDFANLGTSHGFEVKDGNAVVAEDGLYMIFIDMVNDLISIEVPQVHGMGDAFGGWDQGKNPFAVEGATMSATTKADGNLRIYVTNTYAEGIDWWRMELIVRDGIIEYRGNGRDFEDVPVVLANQKVTLDFSNDTGSVQ